MAKGIVVRYTGFDQLPAGVRLLLVPCMWLPFPATSLVVGRDECPTCNLIHPVKTIHLHLDSTGRVMVSEGVLKLLEKAGLELNQLQVVASTDKPPPLKLNGKASRPQLDQENARIQQAWGSQQIGGR